MSIELEVQVNQRLEGNIASANATNGERIRFDGSRSSTGQEAQRENKEKDASEAAEREHGKEGGSVCEIESTREADDFSRHFETPYIRVAGAIPSMTGAPKLFP